MTAGNRAQYAVSGMACDHCVQMITAEVSQVPGITEVAIDLDAERLSVVSTQSIADEVVIAAIDEAGYLAERV